MTVICPSCDARFRDPPAEVLEKQTLQCGKCDHEWAVHEDQPLEIDAPGIVPDMQDLIGTAQEPIRTALPVVIPQIEELSPPVIPIFVDCEEEPTSPSILHKMITPVFTLALIAAACSTIVFKERIVAAVPATAKYYETAGIETKKTGLSIENVMTQRDVKDGISQLIVRGEIANIVGNTVPVPPIQLVMRGQGQTNLYEWTVAAAKNELKAGETSRFTAITKDYPEDAVDVEVKFAR